MIQAADPVIEIAKLTKRYGDLVAVNEISFVVARGEVFGILGPNGAGKTTTLEMVEGLRRPDGGTIVVDGTFVTYRQKGVLRRLRATPMPIGSFITARVLVHLVLALIQAGLVLLVGVAAFHVHVTGTDTLLKVALLALIGSSSFVTIGFFVASVSRNTEIAAALGQVIGTPMMFLSGIFFPMDSASAWIQPVVHAMPLKYLADALRNVIIKGQTLWFVRGDVVILVAVTTVFLGLSVRFFRWE